MTKPVLLAALAFACGGCNWPPTLVYEIPAEHGGWVVVEVENPRCPRLPRVNGRLNIRIGLDSRACTSDVLPTGTTRTEFIRLDGKRTELTRGKMIWGESGVGETRHCGIVTLRAESFFVGTKKDFDTSPRSPLERLPTGGPCPSDTQGSRVNPPPP